MSLESHSFEQLVHVFHILLSIVLHFDQTDESEVENIEQCLRILLSKSALENHVSNFFKYFNVEININLLLFVLPMRFYRYYKRKRTLTSNS